MSDATLMMWMDTIQEGGCLVLFGVVILAVYALLMLVLLFCGLAVRAAWRWLTCAAWRDVIVLAHRRALR